jgi:hypothetical protein
MAKAQFSQFGPQTRLEYRPRPEQPQARFDFKQHCARVMHADLGAEAVGPRREELLPVLDLRRVVLGSGEPFTQGLGGGHALAGAQAQGAGRFVDRLQHPALGRTGQQRQGRVGIGALAQRGVQRQLREKDTDPAHRNLNALRTRETQSAPNAPARPGT